MESSVRTNASPPVPPSTPVVRTSLRTRQHSRQNRLRARELAWEWVAAKWPRLLPAPADRERPELRYALPGRHLAVSTSDDGRVWTLEVAHTERESSCTWRTQATVKDAGDADVIALQTDYSAVDRAAPVIAPPKLLGAWVQNLELDDGGVPVGSDPGLVEDEEQLSAFHSHLVSPTRTLPIIALSNKPGSRYYGVDPWGLAEAVRGMAHVACLTPDMAEALIGQFTHGHAPAPGAARIYRAGFSAADPRGTHSLVRDLARQSPEGTTNQGAFRRLLCRRVCEMSVETV